MDDPTHNSSRSLRKRLTLFSLILAVTSLLYSPFLLSVGMFGLVLLAAVDFAPSGRPVPVPVLGQKLRHFLRRPDYWAPILLFLPVLWTGLYSEDTNGWLRVMRIRLPFLGLPVAFFLLPRLSRKELKAVAGIFIGAAVVVAVGVLVNYAMHFETIQAKLKTGQYIPVPRHHIRFSIGIAIAFTLSVALSLDSGLPRQPRRAATGAAIFLFLFQHILAVRSGLVSLYLAILVLALYGMTVRRFRRAAVLTLLVLVLVPPVALRLVPSLREKVNYTIYDFKMYLRGKGQGYSDSERLTSIQIGLSLGRKHWLTGVGIGDVKQETGRRMKAMHYVKFLDPHNEYVFFFAGAGLPGLLFLLAGLWIPFWYRRHYRNPFFTAIQVIFFLTLMVEAGLETSAGAGYYLLSTLSWLHFFDDR